MGSPFGLLKVTCPTARERSRRLIKQGKNKIIILFTNKPYLISNRIPDIIISLTYPLVIDSREVYMSGRKNSVNKDESLEYPLAFDQKTQLSKEFLLAELSETGEFWRHPMGALNQLSTFTLP
jgi:hypothetical protein